MWETVRGEFEHIQWVTDALVVALNYGLIPQSGRHPALSNLEWNILLDELDVCCCYECSSEARCRNLWSLLDEPRRSLVDVTVTIPELATD